jgi:cytochrome c oxidase cbb3-type subunit 3
MSVTERDPVSGYATTGHDWNGIKELNSPVPRIVLAVSGGDACMR